MSCDCLRLPLKILESPCRIHLLLTNLYAYRLFVVKTYCGKVSFSAGGFNKEGEVQMSGALWSLLIYLHVSYTHSLIAT